jgi:AraC-like DNA-binding protein
MAITKISRTIGPAIRELRVVTFTADEPIAVARLPDATVSLLFRARPDGGGDVAVLGPLTRATYKRAGGLAFTVRVILAPHAARAVVGVPLDQLTDRVIALDVLWGSAGRRLRDRLAGASPPLAARELVDAVLGHGPQRVRATDVLVDRARSLLDAGQPVAQIARTLDVNERTLRRAFTDRIGLSPKRYARIARLQHVLAHAHRGVEWARLAARLGYFDQAHMVNDFRDLVEITPDAFDPARPWPTASSSSTASIGECGGPRPGPRHRGSGVRRSTTGG